MQALLIASSGVVGVVVGAVLDPLGQQLADRSRTVEELRRAERAEQRAANSAPKADISSEVPATATASTTTASSSPSPVPDLHDPVDRASTETTSAIEDADGGIDEDVDAGRPDSVRHLLPEGRSVPRTVGAAIVTGALFACAANQFGSHLILVPYCVFLAMAVAVSVTDLTHRLVPRHLVFGAVGLIIPLLVAVSAVDHTWHALIGSAIGGASAFALFFLLWFFMPRGMGYGDVRLAGAIGLTVGYLSLLHAYVAFLAGFIIGMVFGLVLMVASGAGRKTRIPFAPALCIGAAITILWGGTLVHHIFPTTAGS